MSNEIVKQDKVTDAELTMHLENLGLLKDLTAGEKNSYLQIAKAFNLNPFKREIHVSKYNGTMSIITGYEVYIKRAERTGQLDGWSVATTGTVEGKDLKATITIHRKDRSHPFIWEAEYSEFVQMTDDYKDGKKTGQQRPTKFWQKATMMIKKVAISQGFRLCFSDELGGMPYTADEMPDKTEDIQHEDISDEAVAFQAAVVSAENSLREASAIDFATFQAAWVNVPAGIKPSVLALKDELKAKLQPPLPGTTYQEAKDHRWNQS